MIVGIVLAAGSGTRIGVPKALLRTARDGESFLRRACEVLRAAGVDAVVAVVSVECRDQLGELPPGVDVVVNDDPSRGQLSSLQVALAGLDRLACEAAVVLPVDVPVVSAETIGRLVSTWRKLRPAIVRPARDGRHGHPVVLDRSLFAEIVSAAPGASARPIVRAHATPEGDVPVEDEGAFTDVDTVDEYVRVFRRLPERAAVR